MDRRCQFLDILYSWKIWRGIKFGGLADCMSNRQIKPAKISNLHDGDPAAKFKSANTFVMAI